MISFHQLCENMELAKMNNTPQGQIPLGGDQNQTPPAQPSGPTEPSANDNPPSDGQTGAVSDQAKEVVKAGKNISEDFWDNFNQVMGNAEGVADLLDVSKDKVAQWASKIKKVLDEIGQNEDEGAKDKAASVPTGDGGMPSSPDSTATPAPNLNPTP